MSGNAAIAAIALVMCLVLVAAGVQHRGGFRANWRSAAVWVAIFAGLAVVLTMLGWR